MERSVRSTEKHTVRDDSKLRSLVFKNCYNHRRQDPEVGIFRVRIAKESKLLHLMEHGLEDTLSSEFKQLILNLIK
jgi:hypothetical protein